MRSTAQEVMLRVAHQVQHACLLYKLLQQSCFELVHILYVEDQLSLRTAVGHTVTGVSLKNQAAWRVV